MPESRVRFWSKQFASTCLEVTDHLWTCKHGSIVRGAVGLVPGWQHRPRYVKPNIAGWLRKLDPCLQHCGHDLLSLVDVSPRQDNFSSRVYVRKWEQKSVLTDHNTPLLLLWIVVALSWVYFSIYTCNCIRCQMHFCFNCTNITWNMYFQDAPRRQH